MYAICRFSLATHSNTYFSRNLHLCTFHTATCIACVIVHIQLHSHCIHQTHTFNYIQSGGVHLLTYKKYAFNIHSTKLYIHSQMLQCHLHSNAFTYIRYAWGIGCCNTLSHIVHHNTKVAFSSFPEHFGAIRQGGEINQKDCLPLLLSFCKFQSLKVKSSQATSVSGYLLR